MIALGNLPADDTERRRSQPVQVGKKYRPTDPSAHRPRKYRDWQTRGECI